jgi:hypothetical protein
MVIFNQKAIYVCNNWPLLTRVVHFMSTFASFAIRRCIVDNFSGLNPWADQISTRKMFLWPCSYHLDATTFPDLGSQLLSSSNTKKLYRLIYFYVIINITYNGLAFWYYGESGTWIRFRRQIVIVQSLTKLTKDTLRKCGNNKVFLPFEIFSVSRVIAIQIDLF